MEYYSHELSFLMLMSVMFMSCTMRLGPHHNRGGICHTQRCRGSKIQLSILWGGWYIYYHFSIESDCLFIYLMCLQDKLINMVLAAVTAVFVVVRL